MARFKEKMNCINPACGQTAEIEFTEAIVDRNGTEGSS
jgi:hypothetical protein